MTSTVMCGIILHITERGYMNNLLEPNTTWLVIRKRAYKMAGFDTDYRVEKETKNKGKADQYKHSLEMLNEEKSVSHFIVSVPHE